MPTLISPLKILEHYQGIWHRFKYYQGIWHRFIDRARQARFLLLGEVHGARENPRILITLLAKLHVQIGLRFLGVEWRAEYQTAIDHYVLDGQKDSEPIIPCSEDGRVSLEHHQFLDWLANFNRPLKREEQIQVICFDGVPAEGGDSWNARDRGMYEQLMKEYYSRSQLHHPPALLVAGNLHTRTTPFMMQEEDKDIEHIPFGSYFLKDPSVPSKPLLFNLKYASGEIYNMHVKKLGSNDKLTALFKGKFANAEGLLTEAQGKGDFDFVISQAHPVTIAP